jgi:hypothetical protein
MSERGIMATDSINDETAYVHAREANVVALKNTSTKIFHDCQRR